MATKPVKNYDEFTLPSGTIYRVNVSHCMQTMPCKHEVTIIPSDFKCYPKTVLMDRVDIKKLMLEAGVKPGRHFR